MAPWRALNALVSYARVARVGEHAGTNLSEVLHTLATTYGQRTAVAGEYGSLSFADLDQAADTWAAAFTMAGLTRGAHVGLLAGNGPAWLAVAFGVWRAGATLVPVSTFVTAREFRETLEHADVDALVVQPRLRSHDYLTLLDRLPRLPRLRQVLPLRDAVAVTELAHRPPALASPGAPWANEQERRKRRAVSDAESIACMLYTSGTTGRPKGVMLSHRAILATAVPTMERCGLTSTDSLLSTLPLFWVAGLVIRALPTLLAGCTLILVETFTVEAAIGALRRHRPAALHLRPPQVGQVLGHPDFRPALLANVRKGGGRVDWYAPHLDPDAVRFITGYGMTEMAGYVTALHWQDPVHVRRAQLGAPLPGVELRVVNAGGQPCLAGEVGEIRVRGPGMFSGYYKQPAGAGLDPQGFFVTGDLGRMDASGVFQFVGRSKDLLRVKGINVSPLEVEAVLGMHVGVDAVYVVGLPPDGLEQRLVALIVARRGAVVTEAELRALATEALSQYKWPEQYLFVERDEVPLGGTSKPERAALAALATQRL
ncbi:MAG: AMP-binding protein [Candidatus Binatia bacterium]